MLNELQTIPDGIAETSVVIAQLDDLLLAGFAGRRHHAALESLPRIFAGSPLGTMLNESAAALGRGELHEPHGVALAAARAALTGSQHDALWQQVRHALGRSADVPLLGDSVSATRLPLLDGVRQWLMELVVTGFGRLDVSAMLPFLNTLAYLRETLELARLSFLLTGFIDELLAAFPLARPEDVPLWRWCDLWSAAMLGAVGSTTLPAPQPINGTLYPLGLEVRERDQFVSVIVYGLVTSGETRMFTRLTRSRFKVASIRGDEIWLFFPDLAPLLNALDKGQALDVRDMLQYPTGDLVWNVERVQPGATCRLLDVAGRTFAPQASEPVTVMPPSPLDRHPVQLAEPIVLADYTLSGDSLQLADDVVLPLDVRWSEDRELTREAINNSLRLFGLLRFDAGRWAFQPLSAASRTGKLTFVGQNGVKLLKKPPKQNPVAILEERASRLLRK